MIYPEYVHLGWDGAVEVVSDMSQEAFLTWMEVVGVANEKP